LVFGKAVAFLNPAFELVLSPIDRVEVIVGESAPLLLDATFKLFPVPFDSIPVHDALLFFCLPLHLILLPSMQPGNQLKEKAPPILDGASSSPINVDLDTGARPSDLNTRLSHAATFLDDYIAVTATSADCEVAISVDALFFTQRSDAVLPAEPLGARW